MKKEDIIKILKIEPNKSPYEKEITNELKAKQAEVCGLIELVYLEDNCFVVVNEEGKLSNMEYNRRISDDIICGPFFICVISSDGEFEGLTEEQMKKYTELFAEIPVFAEYEVDAEPHITVRGIEFR